MFTKKSKEDGCDKEFRDLIRIIMKEEELRMPTNANEAKNLYLTLMRQYMS